MLESNGLTAPPSVRSETKEDVDHAGWALSLSDISYSIELLKEMVNNIFKK